MLGSLPSYVLSSNRDFTPKRIWTAAWFSAHQWRHVRGLPFSARLLFPSLLFPVLMSLGEHREFTEAPIPGYTGYVPRRREHDLGTRYGDWSREGYTESLVMRESQESTLTKPVDVKRYREAASSNNGSQVSTHVNPFTPKSDQFQISPAASPEL